MNGGAKGRGGIRVVGVLLVEEDYSFAGVLPRAAAAAVERLSQARIGGLYSLLAATQETAVGTPD